MWGPLLKSSRQRQQSIAPSTSLPNVGRCGTTRVTPHEASPAHKTLSARACVCLSGERALRCQGCGLERLRITVTEGE